MSTNSKIEWTDTTWNPIAGCTPVSAGCKNCYAANHARRLAGNPNAKVRAAYEGTARTAGDGRAIFTGRVNLLPERLEQPLRWRKPRRVFVNAMSDLFHPDVPDEFVDEVFAVMALARRHTFQVLTKRPERMAAYLERDNISVQAAAFSTWERLALSDGWPGWPLPNVWLGTSVEDQAAAEARVRWLLQAPAAVRFLSCEPLIGPVDLTRILIANGESVRDRKPLRLTFDGLRGAQSIGWPGLDWVIAGGESGPGARPCRIEWIRSLVEQCRAAGVPVFVKQLGAMPMGTPNTRFAFVTDPKGGDATEWPDDLRVRQFPGVARG